MIIRKHVLIVPVIFLIACGQYQYKPSYVLPDNIRTVAVVPFRNKTVYFGSEDLLVNELTDEFTRTGRILVKPEKEADAILSGEIVHYKLEPLAYDAHDKVEQYKLWIVVNINFIDRKTNAILWQEENITTDIRYFITPRAGEEVETEEEAVKRAVKELAQEIVQLILRWE